MKREAEPVQIDIPGEDAEPTSEVGSEGGAPGDVELGRIQPPTSGSEATETQQPGPTEKVEIRRDETGAGRRSP